MSAWLANPKKFAPGTKMTFAGLGNPEDRANVMAFLNSRSASPLPLPAVPAASPEKAAARGRGCRRRESRERAGADRAAGRHQSQECRRRRRGQADRPRRRQEGIATKRLAPALPHNGRDAVPGFLGGLRTSGSGRGRGARSRLRRPAPWKSTTRSQNSRPNSRIGSGRTLPVWISVNSSNISSNVPNPPGNTATARARSRKCILRSAK